MLVPSTIPLTVSFTIKVPLIKYNNTSLDLNQTSLQISNDVLAALDKADLTLNISSVVIVTNPSRPPEIRLIRVLCGEGQVQSGAMCGEENKDTLVYFESTWILASLVEKCC